MLVRHLQRPVGGHIPISSAGAYRHKPSAAIAMRQFKAVSMDRAQSATPGHIAAIMWLISAASLLVIVKILRSLGSR